MKPFLRRVHARIGLLLLLPLLGWASTGVIFFVKPGYEGAYESLNLKTYPVTQPPRVQGEWEEIRHLRTILGDHVLVRTGNQWQQLDPVSSASRAAPTNDEVSRLVGDAIRAKPDRYGTVSSVTRLEVRTTTNVTVTLDWNQMHLSQRGPDTDRIDFFYRIHYLQWTGIAIVDRILGAAGIALIFAISVLGIALLRGAS